MLSHFITIAIVLAVSPRAILAQQLPPTDQTSFNYPAIGAGVTLPFPADIAQLTGLSDWPERWAVPPFTPNMQSTFNPSATATIPDIISPPATQGSP